MTTPRVNIDKVSQLVRGHLLAEEAVTDLVGNKIHGGWSRDSDAGTIDKPAVALIIDGGQVVHEGVVASVGLEVWCLSVDSQSEAHNLYHAVAQALHSECLSLPGFDHRGTASEGGTGGAGWTAGAACWYAMGRWTLRVVKDT